MKNFLLISLFIFFLSSCSNLGTTKVKNIVDLTTKLEKESNESLKFSDDAVKNLLSEKSKYYTLSKNPIIAKPAISNDIVYSLDKKGFVSAFSMKTKKIIWRSDIESGSSKNNFCSGGITFNSGKLYVTNGTRNLIVIDAASGHEIMRKQFPDVIITRPIIVKNNVLLVQTVSNQLIAYDINSSKLIWMQEGGLSTISTFSNVDPVIYNGYVIAGYSSGEVVYIEIDSGREKWRYNIVEENKIDLPSFTPSVITSTPIINDNYAYFPTSNGKIVKIDLDNGAPAWTKKAEDIQSMSLIDEVIFVTNNARQVSALSSHNGKILWVGELLSLNEKKEKKIKPAIFQAPLVTKAEDKFFINVVASNGKLYQFSGKSGIFDVEPNIRKIRNNAKYQWISCCNCRLHIITDKRIILF